jgi:predicted ester cyclase
MAREEVRAVVERFIEEVWNEGNLEAAEELIAPEIVYHAPWQTVDGLGAYGQFVESVRTTFPNAQFTYEDLIIEGDRAALRWTLEAAHEGSNPAVPVPPTGMKVNMTGQTAFRLEEGKIAEIWMQTDYSPFLGMAFAAVTAVVGAVVGLLVLLGIIGRLLRGDSEK